MNGPAITGLLLSLCMATATCNGKHRLTGEGTAETADARIDALPALPPPVSSPPVPAAVQPCPAALGFAPPLGPQVGPVCTSSSLVPGGSLDAAIEDIASAQAGGMVPLGPAMGGKAGTEPVTLGSVVLQGPPHCYLIIGACEEEATVVLTLASAGSGATFEAEGETLLACPSSTSVFTLSLSSNEQGASCAGRVYGD